MPTRIQTRSRRHRRRLGGVGKLPPYTENLVGCWTPWSGFFDDDGATDPSKHGEAVHRWSNIAPGQSANYFAQPAGSKRFTLTDDGSGCGGQPYITSDGTDDEMDSILDEDAMNTGSALTLLFGWGVTSITNAIDTPADSFESGSGNSGFQVLNEHRDAINIDECLNLSLRTAGGVGGTRQFGKAGQYAATANEIWAYSYSNNDEIILRNGTNLAPLTLRTGAGNPGAYTPGARAIRIGASHHATGQHSQVDYYFFLYYIEAFDADRMLQQSDWINYYLNTY